MAVIQLVPASAASQSPVPLDSLLARVFDAVDTLELVDYHYLHATRAELLARLGRTDEARTAYERAFALVRSEAERALLERRLEEL